MIVLNNCEYSILLQRNTTWNIFTNLFETETYER